MSVHFAVVGLEHDHVFSLTDLLINAGAQVDGVYAADSARLTRYLERYPQAKRAASEADILGNPAIDLVIGVPSYNERSALGIRVMESGKDYLVDKPGFITLEQIAEARAVQARSGRKFLIYLSERLASPATVKAYDLVKSGAIGRVIHVVGMGPHLLNAPSRQDWFFERSETGGILNDLACHQIDQFLHFTGSTSAQITSSRLANFNHPEYPNFDDYGDITLHSDHATAFVRVDWFTPNGLGTWGDVRLFVMGTDGYLELRKNCDLQGREGANHLFLVNQSGQQYVDCSDTPMLFGEQLVYDIAHRAETALGQEHCFVVSELALQAEANATRIG